ncbi:ABC-2 type transport system permease protein [Dehalogenimonas formicexedens]|uniref:ABC-2 type transport system permease protein n=1 Tax=Dehalogenimonas formicexedens TaxID=1839801 RepID=A0A1P8F956_9CHLR|nr:ABC transporter permease subunit [Dehalogenimonas formicexedens]APV44973.1 ABC-2 type transport system permease protein [Dehalogenimonas formicexedens]
MVANVFLHEFRMKLKSALGWSVAVAAVVFAFSAMFSTISSQIGSVNDFLNNFPKELLIAFGLNGVDLSTILGFYSFMFLFAQLLLAIQAASYGFGLVSVEEAEWTADFLLTKPVKRDRILSSKLLAAFAGLTITNAATWVASLTFLNLFKGSQSFDTGTLFLLLASIVVFQLFFLGVGLGVSLLVKRVRSVITYALALSFGMYVLAAFGNLLGSSILEKISPFKHFDPVYIIGHNSYDAPLVVVSVLVIVVSIAAGYMLYTRRDIPAVA